MNIQWYPGHMTKTKRQITRDIALVDIILELLDARIPRASRNPDIDELAAGKKRVVILNKSDLAHEKITAEWRAYYENLGFPVITANSASPRGRTDVFDIAAALMREKIAKHQGKGRIGTTTRAIVLGIPNVGKSTLINQYAKRSAAAAADKPGVTRGKQWIRVRPDFELLDTPGILWPKLEDPEVALNLAITGAIKDAILDTTELACACITLLTSVAPLAIPSRYKTDAVEGEPPDVTLARIAAARGFLLKGGIPDMERASVTLLDEFRGGKLGRISLERTLNL